MRKIGIPNSIDWSLVYSLAYAIRDKQWDLLHEKKIAHYRKGDAESVFKRLRNFSKNHENRNPLQMAQSAFLIYKDIHTRKAEPTPLEVRATADRILQLREKYANLDYFGPKREMIMAASSEKRSVAWKDAGFLGYRFAPLGLRTEVFKDHPESALYFYRAPDDVEGAENTMQQVLDRFVTAEGPFTFYFDGHGTYKSSTQNGLEFARGVKLTAQQMVAALEVRYKNERVRTRAATDPDVFIFASCFGYDIGERMNVLLSEKGLPGVVIISAADRNSLGFSTFGSLFGSTFNELLARARTLEIFRIFSFNPELETRPTITVPDTLPNPSHGKRRGFMQISGTPPAGDIAIG